MATTKKIPSDSILLNFLRYGQNSDLIQSIPMTTKFANRLSKLQRKLEIEERDIDNPNEMKNLSMGDKRFKKHMEALLDLDRAQRKDKKDKNTKLRHDGMYSPPPNKKGGSVTKSKYSKGGGVRAAKYKV